MKLLSLTVKNFQSHVESAVTFGRVTTIVGNTNAGKTSIIRALKAFVDNASPRVYVRDGASSLSVGMYYVAPDGATKYACWEKGKGINVYTYGEEKEGAWVFQEFKNVGTEVPACIESSLQMGPLLSPKKEKYYPNFRTQVDLPAIVYESESDRLSKLVRISGIGLVQAAMRFVAKDLKALEREKSVAEDRLEVLRGELAKYEGVEAKVRSLEFVVELVSNVAGRKAIYDEVLVYKGQLDAIDRLEWAEGAAAALMWAKTKMEALIALDQYKRFVESIPVSVEDFKAVFSSLKDKVVWVEQLVAYGLLIDRVPPDLAKDAKGLSLIAEEVEKYRELLKFRELKRRVVKATEEINVWGGKKEESVERRDLLRGEITTCPVCGRS